MITKQHTLASGRVVTLAMPDLFKLAAFDTDIPNTSLADIMDLIVYGGMVSGTAKDPKKRVEENRQFLRSQFELVALVIQEPKLVLRGDVPEGALVPSDITARDLREIVEFFQTGGSRSAPATEDRQSDQGAQADLPSATVGEVAE